MKYIDKIIDCFNKCSVYYTKHAKLEMHNEEFGKIKEEEVFEAVSNGEIIEEYPDDHPYPSLLIFGKTKLERPLHIVCAYNELERITVIITVYHPDSDLWIDFKRRLNK